MLDGLKGRTAHPASWKWNLLKTFMQTVVFWGVFLSLIPAGIFHFENITELAHWRFTSSAAIQAGSLLFVLGGGLGLTSGFVMSVWGQGTPLPSDCPRELVVAGPYRYLRNPMVVAGLTQGVAVGLMLSSPLVIAYALLGAPVWNGFVRPWEEADLEIRFGDSYRHYRKSIRCWLPKFPGYSQRMNPSQDAKQGSVPYSQRLEEGN